MKKCFALILSFVILFSFTPAVRAVDEPETGAEAFVLYCVENRKIILSKNENKRMKPASTTKLMTVLLTLEEAAKNDRAVTFTEEMAAEGSSMYLQFGEQVRLSDLAAGMMMASGNDAANAAAIATAGSLEKFALRMNARAADIGMEHTHFVTPSGLDDDAHYTTAYDMALLMEAGLRNSAFADLTYQKSVGVQFVKPSDKRITYTNHNRLLRLCEDCIGGKTGYTDAAGRCLVSAARRNGLTLICVTLHDRSDWNDHIALYNYGFSRYCGYRSEDSSLLLDLPCVGGVSDSVTVTGDSDVSLVLKSGEAEQIQKKTVLDSFVYAPVKQGETLGRIDYLLHGRVIHSTPLTAAEDVKRRTVKKSLWKTIKEWFSYG